MGEEFQESDVVFSDYSNKNTSQATPNTTTHKTKTRLKHTNNKNSYSVPINIPDNGVRYINITDYDDGGEKMPPHVIVARRRRRNGCCCCREMACSYWIEDSKGRIMKGRHLCEVRNSILRLTGFIET